MGYCLETISLCKKYGDFQALNGLSMHIPKGAIYGLVGKNGAGKTTLIRLITGIQNPTSGEYSLYNIKNTDMAINKTRRRMGAVVETPAVYLDMTAEENLIMQYKFCNINYNKMYDADVGLAFGLIGKEKVEEFDEWVKSKDQKCCALCGSPDFLILDEPINGLDPQGIVEIRELILKLNRDYQITIFISSHILGELSKLATHYGFVDGGKIVKEIDATELELNCRKCTHLSVTDTKALCRVLDGLNIEYSLTSDTEADIFGKINITQLTLALAKENCEIMLIQKQDESLENYYMNVIGGHTNA